MPTRDDGRRNQGRFPARPNYPPHDDTRLPGQLPLFLYGMPAPQPIPRRRPHRGQLPDVDFSQAVMVERPSAMARFAARLWGLVRRRKPPPLVKPDTTA